MYRLSIQSVFSAAHALTIHGRPEPLHGHDWLVTATLAGTRLDPDGLLIDFHAVERSLRAITDSLNNSNLNDHPHFTRTNTSCEHVARFIAERLIADLSSSVPFHTSSARARLHSLRLTEAPGCAITYYPPLPQSTSPMAESP